MSQLLDQLPYAPRDDALLLRELNALDMHHRHASAPYGSMVGDVPSASRIEDLPFVHVGLFKRMDMAASGHGIAHARNVVSSSTSGTASRIAIDDTSSALQGRSSEAILGDFIGHDRRPLLVLDSVASLRRRGEFSARVLAAMSLKPFASEVFFLLKEAADAASLQVSQVECALKQPGPLIVYGFSWVLWLAWAQAAFPADIAAELRTRKIAFVHSGGWKKLEDRRVDRGTFDGALLAGAAGGSSVVDYYGLVEQMGVVYPLCEAGARHVPRWADVVVRDSWTLRPLAREPGQLQLLNTLSWGTPCHSVLTEDVGVLLPGACPCGRTGTRFELMGRVPQAELRGCANVG